MSIALRATIAVALACVFNPIGVCAEPLLQPISVVPGVPPAAWLNRTAGKKASWLHFESVSTAFEDVKHTSTTTSPFPMVEMESFSILGEIRNDRIHRYDVGPTAEPAAIDLSTSGPDSFPPLGFFRARRDQTGSRAVRR